MTSHTTRALVARSSTYDRGMCRSIKPLNNFEPPATDDEVREAALQFVRKISGTQKPASVNTATFEAAVDEVSRAARALLDQLVTTAPPKDRAVEAAQGSREDHRPLRDSRACSSVVPILQDLEHVLSASMLRPWMRLARSRTCSTPTPSCIDAGDLDGVARPLHAWPHPRGRERAPVVGLRGPRPGAGDVRDVDPAHDDGTPKTKHVTTNAQVWSTARPAVPAATTRCFQATADLPLQPIITGRYHDTFHRLDGQWWFDTRVMLVDQLGDLSHHLK